MHDSLLYTREIFWRQTLFESAGLFWLAAEIAILYGVVAGREHLAGNPRDAFHWSPRQRRRAWVWGGTFCAVIALTFARHLWLPPVHTLLATNPDEAWLGDVLRGRLREHLLIWSAFVLGWVVLEAAIVYQGWRAYQRLRELLDAPPSKPSTNGVVAALAFALLLGAARSEALPWFEAVHADEQVYRNAVYLWLRIAGVAWILIEWIAAVVLWRGYVLLRDTARKQHP